jgi:hypothetical protein
MSHSQKTTFAPFVSVFFLVVIGLSYVFVKMETVRAGYDVVRFGHLLRVGSSDKAQLDLVYARLTRPERLDHIGTQRLALLKAQKNQVVLMAAEGFARELTTQQ